MFHFFPLDLILVRFLFYLFTQRDGNHPDGTSGRVSSPIIHLVCNKKTIFLVISKNRNAFHFKFISHVHALSKKITCIIFCWKKNAIIFLFLFRFNSYQNTFTNKKKKPKTQNKFCKNKSFYC